MTNRSLPAALAACAISVLAVAASAALTSRSGPAQHPEKYADYGGTPDITLSDDLGLSEKEVEELLSRTASPDRQARIEAALELARAAAGSEQVLREVLWKPHGARNAQMREVMLIARRKLADSEDEEAGLLGILLDMNPKNEEKGQGTMAAVRVMTMLVALWKLDTMAGYKVMLDFSGRHAGVFRQEIGRMMVARGFNALPALIYGRGSDNDELHMFAVKWIRDMGNPLLGDQVREIKNPRRLAQLLEAYASVNELDAIDVTVSLASHDSIFVRQAARACLEAYGKNAKWSVRRQYENTFGEEPGADTGIEDWLKKLYARWDGKRMARALEKFEAGREAMATGRLEEMADLYAQVLRDEPMFERRHEMAAGFLELAAGKEEAGELDEARASTLMAARVAEEDSGESKEAISKLAWLEAESRRLAGVLDQEYYWRAAATDSDNDEARQWGDLYRKGSLSGGKFVFKVAAVSLMVFFSSLLVYLRLRTRARAGKGR